MHSLLLEALACSRHAAINTLPGKRVCLESKNKLFDENEIEMAREETEGKSPVRCTTGKGKDEKEI